MFENNSMKFAFNHEMKTLFRYIFFTGIDTTGLNKCNIKYCLFQMVYFTLKLLLRVTLDEVIQVVMDNKHEFLKFV